AGSVFRCKPYLVAGKFQRYLVQLAGFRKMQRAPIDGDLATADAEKSAKVDYRRAHLTRATDQDVDDAPHILSRNATDALAQYSVNVLIIDHGGGGAILRHRRNRRGRR